MNQKTAIRQLKELERLGGVKKMRLAAEKWREEWQTLVAIMLSARTRDETAIRVSEALFAKYKTPAALARASAAEATRIIRPVNFFRNKTKNVLACARALTERYRDAPPHDLSKLIELPGVGRKTANVFLSEYGADAIGVDTHVSYISQKLGWTRHRDPHKIERDLEQLFPRNYWSRVNGACVRFGKSYMSRRKKDEILKGILSAKGRIRLGRKSLISRRFWSGSSIRRGGSGLYP